MWKNITKITLLLLLTVIVTPAVADSDPPLCPSARHPQHAAQNAKRAAKTRQSAVYRDDHRQLVLLASFNDLTFMDEDPLSLWNSIFNEEGMSTPPFHGSVHDYFYDQSYGQFNLQFDLYHVALDKPHADFRSVGDDDSNSGLLLMDLIDAIREEVSDWSVYDWDGDGYVDQVLILYAGQGQNDGGGSQAIWPHQWSLTGQEREAYAVTSGGNEYLIDNYGCFPELSGSKNYGTFGTLCHEYGHCLGLPDFYYSNKKVVGAWDIMDYGNYNEGGFCPPGYSAHERMLLGWLDMTELTEPTTVNDLMPLCEGQEAYMIRNDNYANEYYIIENRQPIKWDSSLPGSGVLIFHIDYDEEVWHTGQPNTSQKKRYTIFAANNSNTDFSHWAYPYEQNDSLTNLSTPASMLYHLNSEDNYYMNRPVYHISVNDDGVASFDFMDDPTGIVFNSQPSTLHLPPSSIYNLQGRIIGNDINALSPGIYIIRYGNEVKKVMVR